MEICVYPEYFYSASLYKTLSEYDEKMTNTCQPLKELSKFLEEVIYNEIIMEFGDHFDFSVNIERDEPRRGIPKGWIGVGGEYMFGNILSVEITLHDPHCDYIYFDYDKWDHLKRELGQTVDHEIIHSRQFRQREHLGKDKMFMQTFPDEPEKDYYGDSDEIQAYGYNIARDLLVYFEYDKQLALEEVRNTFPNVDMGCVTALSSYIKLFKDGEYYEDDLVWKKLIKTITKYIEKIHDEEF